MKHGSNTEKRFGRWIIAVSIALVGFSSVWAEPPAPEKKPTAAEKKPPADAKLPITGLSPAKLFPGICLLKYRVSTTSPQCQALFDQGLGYYYSYVWMEAAR